MQPLAIEAQACASQPGRTPCWLLLPEEAQSKRAKGGLINIKWELSGYQAIAFWKEKLAPFRFASRLYVPHNLKDTSDDHRAFTDWSRLERLNCFNESM